ncbi:unnamed protein product [Ambrosiozyma monospora]|uniref:Unnamed protein product n=1 Tax=Ambrosiozyma monospora TaxID=43982 RepID=A0ACB5T7R8_AMBMO|nr:unnamed protein product [Ambrosiozyma monospora]
MTFSWTHWFPSSIQILIIDKLKLPNDEKSFADFWQQFICPLKKLTSIDITIGGSYETLDLRCFDSAQQLSSVQLTFRPQPTVIKLDKIPKFVSYFSFSLIIYAYEYPDFTTLSVYENEEMSMETLKSLITLRDTDSQNPFHMENTHCSLDT